jgi:hypothetical protein
MICTLPSIALGTTNSIRGPVNRSAKPTRISIPIGTSGFLGGRIAERVGRLKSNGRIVRRSPLSSLLELEMLRLAVEGKAACWRTLARAVPASSNGGGSIIAAAASNHLLSCAPSKALTLSNFLTMIGVAPKTVANHVEHIYAKIEVSSRAAAALFAMQHGLLGGSFEPPGD